MAIQDENLSPKFPERAVSPSPHLQPTLALSPSNDQRRYFSTGSTSSSNSSYRSSSLGPLSATESQGSSSRDSSASFSTRRPVSGSYTSRQATGGLERPKGQRRGYVRPQGTNFALSAQSRESVMNLGSIAHLQYYFARTGLLDGKGGQLAKKKESELKAESCGITAEAPRREFSQSGSTYTSSRNSPDFGPTEFSTAPGGMSPGIAGQEEYFYSEDEDEDSIEMLPPTVSTYNDRPKPTPRLPTHAEYKDNLRKCLQDAARSLAEAKAAAPVCPDSPAASHLRSPSKVNANAIAAAARMRSESNATLLTGEGEGPENQNQGWYEVQGVHILDVVTLAIRAARQYYTAHPNPMRLNGIKSERRIRAELLGVMEVLRRMATRNFSKGMRAQEVETMERWVGGCWDMLSEEESIEKRELEERRSWTWLEDSSWPPSTPESPPNTARELAFLRSLDPNTANDPLPDDLTSNFDSDPLQPSPFLLSLQSGLRLVQLHNAMVAKSKRPFGSIPTFHTDTKKPYRMAENLKFWIKAAELRWEVILRVDVSGVVGGVDGEAWRGFESSLWRWARQVRLELTADLNSDERPMTALPIREVVRRDREFSRDRTHIVVEEPQVVG